MARRRMARVRGRRRRVHLSLGVRAPLGRQRAQLIALRIALIAQCQRVALALVGTCTLSGQLLAQLLRLDDERARLLLGGGDARLNVGAIAAQIVRVRLGVVNGEFELAALGARRLELGRLRVQLRLQCNRYTFRERRLQYQLSNTEKEKKNGRAPRLAMS